jgi:hypothetical protein
MDVNGLPLPALLVELIENRRWKSPRGVDRLADIAGFRHPRKLDFMKPDGMQRETDALLALYAQGFADFYGLTKSDSGGVSRDDPSRLDARLAVVLANNWDEEGLCLDYRPGLNQPRVLAGTYPNDTSPMQWRVIAKDFSTFAELMGF